MEETFPIFEDKNPQPMDIIEIIESHYVPAHPIGNRYVVIETFDGYDVCIINERGEYDMVCGEDYRIIGSVEKARKTFQDTIVKRDYKFFGKKIHDFIQALPPGKVQPYEYQALHKGEWMPVSRINKSKKTFALSHEGGEMIVSYLNIEDIKGYLD